MSGKRNETNKEEQDAKVNQRAAGYSSTYLRRSGLEAGQVENSSAPFDSIAALLTRKDNNDDKYPPIVTIDGRVDTDIDHLIDDLEDDYTGPVVETPSRFPKPHVFSVIDGSLDDDIDSYANDDGAMEHTLVDAPKNYNSMELRDVASKDTSVKTPGQAKGGPSGLPLTNRSFNKTNVETAEAGPGYENNESDMSVVPLTQVNMRFEDEYDEDMCRGADIGSRVDEILAGKDAGGAAKEDSEMYTERGVEQSSIRVVESCEQISSESWPKMDALGTSNNRKLSSKQELSQSNDENGAMVSLADGDRSVFLDETLAGELKKDLSQHFCGPDKIMRPDEGGDVWGFVDHAEGAPQPVSSKLCEATELEMMREGVGTNEECVGDTGIADSKKEDVEAVDTQHAEAGTGLSNDAEKNNENSLMNCEMKNSDLGQAEIRVKTKTEEDAKQPSPGTFSIELSDSGYQENNGPEPMETNSHLRSNTPQEANTEPNNLTQEKNSPPEPNNLSQEKNSPPEPNSLSQEANSPPEPNSLAQEKNSPPEPNSLLQEANSPPEPNSPFQEANNLIQSNNPFHEETRHHESKNPFHESSNPPEPNGAVQDASSPPQPDDLSQIKNSEPKNPFQEESSPPGQEETVLVDTLQGSHSNYSIGPDGRTETCHSHTSTEPEEIKPQILDDCKHLPGFRCSKTQSTITSSEQSYVLETQSEPVPKDEDSSESESLSLVSQQFIAQLMDLRGNKIKSKELIGKLRDIVRESSRAEDKIHHCKEKSSQEKIPMERQSQEKLPNEKPSQEMMPKERQSQEMMPKERQSQEKLPKERQNQEKLPIERQSQEKLPKERQSQEKLPKERQSQEKLPKERQSQEMMPKERQSQEKLPKERQSQEKLPKERQSQEMMPKERQNQEKLHKERQSQEKLPKERQSQEKLPTERQSQEMMPKERQNQEKLPKERQSQEMMPKERHNQEKLPKERQSQEMMPKERQNQENLPKERQSQEMMPKERQNQEKLHKERQSQEMMPVEKQKQETGHKDRHSQHTIPNEMLNQEMLPMERTSEENLSREGSKDKVLPKQKQNQEMARMEKPNKEMLSKLKRNQETVSKEKLNQEEMAPKEQPNQEIFAKETPTNLSVDRNMSKEILTGADACSSAEKKSHTTDSLSEYMSAMNHPSTAESDGTKILLKNESPTEHSRSHSQVMDAVIRREYEKSKIKVQHSDSRFNRKDALKNQELKLSHKQMMKNQRSSHDPQNATSKELAAEEGKPMKNYDIQDVSISEKIAKHEARHYLDEEKRGVPKRDDKEGRRNNESTREHVHREDREGKDKKHRTRRDSEKTGIDEISEHEKYHENDVKVIKDDCKDKRSSTKHRENSCISQRFEDKPKHERDDFAEFDGTREMKHRSRTMPEATSGRALKFKEMPEDFNQADAAVSSRNESKRKMEKHVTKRATEQDIDALACCAKKNKHFDGEKMDSIYSKHPEVAEEGHKYSSKHKENKEDLENHQASSTHRKDKMSKPGHTRESSHEYKEEQYLSLNTVSHIAVPEKKLQSKTKDKYSDLLFKTTVDKRQCVYTEQGGVKEEMYVESVESTSTVSQMKLGKMKGPDRKMKSPTDKRSHKVDQVVIEAVQPSEVQGKTRHSKESKLSIKQSLKAALRVAEESLTAAARVTQVLNNVMKAAAKPSVSTSSSEDDRIPASEYLPCTKTNYTQIPVFRRAVSMSPTKVVENETLSDIDQDDKDSQKKKKKSSKKTTRAMSTSVIQSKSSSPFRAKSSSLCTQERAELTKDHARKEKIASCELFKKIKISNTTVQAPGGKSEKSHHRTGATSVAEHRSLHSVSSKVQVKESHHRESTDAKSERHRSSRSSSKKRRRESQEDHDAETPQGGKGKAKEVKAHKSNDQPETKAKHSSKESKTKTSTLDVDHKTDECNTHKRKEAKTSTKPSAGNKDVENIKKATIGTAVVKKLQVIDTCQESIYRELPNQRPPQDLPNQRPPKDLPNQRPPQDLPNQRPPQDLPNQRPPQDLPNQRPPKDLPNQRPPQDLPNQRPPQDLHNQRPPQDLPNQRPPQDLPNQRPPQENISRELANQRPPTEGESDIIPEGKLQKTIEQEGWNLPANSRVTSWKTDHYLTQLFLHQNSENSHSAQLFIRRQVLGSKVDPNPISSESESLEHPACNRTSNNHSNKLCEFEPLVLVNDSPSGARAARWGEPSNEERDLRSVHCKTSHVAEVPQLTRNAADNTKFQKNVEGELPWRGSSSTRPSSSAQRPCTAELEGYFPDDPTPPSLHQTAKCARKKSQERALYACYDSPVREVKDRAERHLCKQSCVEHQDSPGLNPEVLKNNILSRQAPFPEKRVEPFSRVLQDKVLAPFSPIYEEASDRISFASCEERSRDIEVWAHRHSRSRGPRKSRSRDTDINNNRVDEENDEEGDDEEERLYELKRSAGSGVDPAEFYSDNSRVEETEVRAEGEVVQEGGLGVADVQQEEARPGDAESMNEAQLRKMPEVTEDHKWEYAKDTSGYEPSALSVSPSAANNAALSMSLSATNKAALSASPSATNKAALSASPSAAHTPADDGTELVHLVPSGDVSVMQALQDGTWYSFRPEQLSSNDDEGAAESVVFTQESPEAEVAPVEEEWPVSKSSSKTNDQTGPVSEEVTIPVRAKSAPFADGTRSKTGPMGYSKTKPKSEGTISSAEKKRRIQDQKLCARLAEISRQPSKLDNWMKPGPSSTAGRMMEHKRVMEQEAIAKENEKFAHRLFNLESGYSRQKQLKDYEKAAGQSRVSTRFQEEPVKLTSHEVTASKLAREQAEEMDRFICEQKRKMESPRPLTRSQSLPPLRKRDGGVSPYSRLRLEKEFQENYRKMLNGGKRSADWTKWMPVKMTFDPFRIRIESDKQVKKQAQKIDEMCRNKEPPYAPKPKSATSVLLANLNRV
ncbi:microtubule-associated protein futsch-like [Physella acuta]|uniref:microtubule-associated protein futsch-like n=1 Tax=Physella acuta TaxID=109671 RepID=UPI0027DC8D37|nr:microtubule-associated protein futsch-like [Physella acuta]